MTSPSLLAPGFRERPLWWDDAEPGFRGTALPARADVAVVGGGYAGLSAALTLARLGLRPVVLDAERMGWGASSRNGGAVLGGLKIAAGALEKALGPERARELALAAAASFPFVEELIAREAISCDYTRCGRFVPAWSTRHYDALAARVEFVASTSGLPARMLPRGQQREALGSDHYRGGMLADAAGSLHPGKYARGLAEAAERAGSTLVDNTRVLALEREGAAHALDTDRGRLRADAVLVATNGYSRNPDGGAAMPWLARRTVPVASCAVATAELPAGLVDRLFPGRRVVSDTRRALHYFRPSPDGRRVVWGGHAFPDPRAAAPALHRAMTEVFPELAGVPLTHAWTGNVAFTFDFLPHLGVRDGVHYVAGCQGSGVAMASWLGHRAALRVAGADTEPFALADLPFPTLAGYDGRPWFLPLVDGWYRLRDRLDRIAA